LWLLIQVTTPAATPTMRLTRMITASQRARVDAFNG
jgi:hypothetical protein